MLVHLIVLFYFKGCLQRIRACIFRVMSTGRIRAACLGSEPPQGHCSPALAGKSNTASLEPLGTAQLPKDKRIYTKPKLSRALLSLSAMAHVWWST